MEKPDRLSRHETFDFAGMMTNGRQLPSDADKKRVLVPLKPWDRTAKWFPSGSSSGTQTTSRIKWGESTWYTYIISFSIRAEDADSIIFELVRVFPPGLSDLFADFLGQDVTTSQTEQAAKETSPPSSLFPELLGCLRNAHLSHFSFMAFQFNHLHVVMVIYQLRRVYTLIN